MADGSQEMDALDARAIGTALRVSARAVRMRAAKEGWPSTARVGVGGKQLVYPLATLPEDVRTAVLRQRALEAAASLPSSRSEAAGRQVGRKLRIAAAVDAAVSQRARERGQVTGAGLTSKARERMEAKLELLAKLGAFARARGIGTCAAMDEFCDAYNSGEHIVDVWVRNFTSGDLHPATLRRWRRLLKSQGPAALAGEYGNRKGAGAIDSDLVLRDFICGVLMEKPHISARLIHDAIEARHPDRLPKPRTVERFLHRWKRDNAALFLRESNPDAYRSKHLTAFGSYAEGIVRANQVWMLDSTPADLQLVDGRYNLIGVVDVATRRFGLHVSRTSTADAVCQIIRRFIIEWGMPEGIKVDNGKEFANERLARATTALEIPTHFSTPFSPQEKPYIERGFKTFSHHLLTLLPGYSGHNVAEAQALRARTSFADSLFKKGGTLEVKLTAAELQAFCDRWVDDFYMHEPHAGDDMDGKTPFERLTELRSVVRVVQDVRALDLLLGAGQMASVRKKGIKIDGLWYAAPELGPLSGTQDRVLVRRDDGDLGRIVVYHDDAFLCVAECPEVVGVSRREVALLARQRQAADMAEKRAALRGAKKSANVATLANDILTAKAAKHASLTAFPAENVAYLTPAIEAAREAADELEAWERREDPALLASIDRVIREHQRSDETAEQRFRACMDLLLREDSLNDLEAQRLRNYRDTPEFQARWDGFICFGARGLDLDPIHDALLPADAPFYSQGG